MSDSLMRMLTSLDLPDHVYVDVTVHNGHAVVNGKSCEGKVVYKHTFVIKTNDDPKISKELSKGFKAVEKLGYEYTGVDCLFRMKKAA